MIISAARAPTGSFGGSLKDVLHERLAATVMEEVCKGLNFPKEDIDDIYWSAVMIRNDEDGLARGLQR